MGNAITFKRGVVLGAVVAVSVYAVWRRSRAAVPEPVVPVARPAPELVLPQTSPVPHGQGRRRTMIHRGRPRKLSPTGWPKQRPLHRNRPAWPAKM